MLSEISSLKCRYPQSNVVVVGSSPSMGTIANHENEIGLWLGDAHRRTNCKTEKSFYVRANSEYPDLNNPTHVQELSNKNFDYVLAETVMESETPVRFLAEQMLKDGDIFVFDQRHFGGKPCDPIDDCCRVLVDNPRLGEPATLQELLAEQTNRPHHYSSADSVALHAFALAILMGAKRINLTGIDLPFYRKDYIYASPVGSGKRSLKTHLSELMNKFHRYRPSPKAVARRLWVSLKLRFSRNDQAVSIFAPDFPRLFSDFQYLVDIALSEGIDVRYCSQNSALRHVNGLRECDNCIG